MKQIERHLCAECWQNVVAAGLQHEEIPRDGDKRKPCDWCGRFCYGSVYRIYYGKDKT